MSARCTIGASATLSGIGLHLGRPCRLTFLPAAAGTGIIFRRVDLPGSPETPATVDRAILTERRTQLGEGEGALHTVEHVLAAVLGAEVDDVVIEMDAAEPPILDGSARPFLEALRGAGPVANGAGADELRIREPVRVVDGESVYVVHPAERLDV